MEGTEKITNISNDTWIYLLNNRGLKQQPLEVAIPLTVVNIFIFVTGLFGNVAVCMVIFKHRSLHTATNYYLFNLAVSDLTLLIFGLPNDVAMYWHQYPWILGDFFCKLRALISEMATYVSVLTIVAFSTERYIAICYPLYLHTMSGLERALRIILCLWLVSFFAALPFSLYSGVDYLLYPNSTIIFSESALCGMLSQPDGFPLIELSTLIFFFIPLLVIAVQYTKMALEISKTSHRSLGGDFKGCIHKDNRKSQSNKAIIRMLSAVVIGFFICWAPFHAQRLLIIYGSHCDYFPQINAWMFFITGIFYYFSSTLNPILYNIMSDRMRNAFKELIYCKKHKYKGSQTSRDGSRLYHTSFQRIPNSSVLVDDDKHIITTRTKLLTEITFENKKNQQIETCI